MIDGVGLSLQHNAISLCGQSNWLLWTSTCIYLPVRSPHGSPQINKGTSMKFASQFIEVIVLVLTKGHLKLVVSL
jgi:hypothetical protein